MAAASAGAASSMRGNLVYGRERAHARVRGILAALSGLHGIDAALGAVRTLPARGVDEREPVAQVHMSGRTYVCRF
jgi:hypothetical protein